MNAVGHQEHLYDDFRDETFELLRDTAASINAQESEAALLSKFNDESLSSAIITYFKVSS